MLTDLSVRDLGVIEDLYLELGPGMTALTGETGAGKTLVVGALELLLGGRASPGLVRVGAIEAVVEARFVIEDRQSGRETETTLIRTVPASGRSRAWLDGRAVPVSALGEPGAALVDIHGQHDQQSLLDPGAQRAALDGFCGVNLSELHAARDLLRSIDERLADLGGDPQQRAREIDVLSHQVAEIDTAGIGDLDEEERLVEEEARLADLGAHRAAAAQALAELVGVEDGASGSAVDLVGRAGATLGGRAPFTQWHERLGAVLAELTDVASDLRNVVDTWEDDPVRLADVQARRRFLAELRRKYGESLAEVTAFGVQASARLTDLLGASDAAENLVVERSAAVAALEAAGRSVLQSRRVAAPQLAEAAAARLHDLAMPGARLEVEVDGATGETVRFMLGANVGESLQPLTRVASGGELARTMLALRLVTMGGPTTMVFDEVDAGVGGTAALSLGRALREVAGGRQVIVVTHLAQVAAAADHQVAVRKSTRQGRTVTDAVALSEEGRIIEISRMLSGHPDSATARAHAKELLASVRSPDQSTTMSRRGG